MNEPIIVSEAPRQDAAVIDQELQEMRDRVSALQKPFLGAPIFPSSNMQEGFQFGRRQVREMNEKSDERPVRTMYRCPEEAQKDISELIQRYEN